jgi:CheY-like chemotaxis protein
LVVGLAVWRLFPSIKKIVESRGFTVKVGPTELTVQEVSEKFLQSTADIQDKLASMTSPTSLSAEKSEKLPSQSVQRILWVDDNPSNNAYEIAQLNTLGVNVVQVESTEEGIAIAYGYGTPFDAVISDMGRQEESGYNATAGIDLIKQLRERGYAAPIFIYASRAALSRRNDILGVGGNGVTTSPTELFALLRTVGPFPGTDVTTI